MDWYILKDRKPQNGNIYLVVSPLYGYLIAKYADEVFIPCDGLHYRDEQPIDDVVAWAELPPPPLPLVHNM